MGLFKWKFLFHECKHLLQKAGYVIKPTHATLTDKTVKRLGDDGNHDFDDLMMGVDLIL